MAKEEDPSVSFRYPPLSGDSIPLTKQPNLNSGEQTAEGWVPVPLGRSVCPPGLEYLSMVDQLLVQQKIEIFEILTGCETKNKYKIKNSMGQPVYSAKEETDCCTRYCCGPLRCFEMSIKDVNDMEVIRLSRDLRCNCCCCPCCLQTMDVMSPPGTLVGRIMQEWSICTPKFRVEDASGDTVFLIEGPFCVVSCCSDVEFPVFTPNGIKVGQITKQWSGLVREMFTDADHFGITFPLDLDVKMKAVLLGALFLIDFNYFETQQS